MANHEEDVPRSTAYEWAVASVALDKLIIWAAWKKARINGASCPSFEQIFAAKEPKRMVWQCARTRELTVSAEKPKRGKWVEVDAGHFLIRKGQRVDDPVHFLASALDRILAYHLSPAEVTEILTLLPITSTYAQHPWCEDMDDPSSVDTLRRRIQASKAINKAKRLLRQSAAIGPEVGSI